MFLFQFLLVLVVFQQCLGDYDKSKENSEKEEVLTKHITAMNKEKKESESLSIKESEKHSPPAGRCEDDCRQVKGHHYY